MKTRTLSFSLIVCLLGIATPLFGQDDTFWINPAGGEFVHPTNWDNGVPGATDTAVFDLNSAYEVEIVTSQTIGELLLEAGDVTFDGGNTLTVNGASRVDSGTMRVAGNLSNIVADSNVIGFNGNGAMFVEAGGVVTGVNGIVGANAGSNGTVTVRGAASNWNTSNLYLGTDSTLQNRGVGELIVETEGEVFVGDTTFSTSLPQLLAVGDSGGNGNLFIFNGSKVDTGIGHATVGVRVNNTGSIFLSGEGSELNSRFIDVGQRGSGNLIIENGAKVTSQFLDIADGNGGTGQVEVRGSGSEITVHQFRVSTGGAASATLIVEGGGSINSNISRFGPAANVVVDGSNTVWNNADYFSVSANNANAVSILNGAVVSVGGTTTIAGDSTVQLQGGRFEFGEAANLESYQRIVGTSGELSGVVGFDGNTDINSISGTLVNDNLDTSEVRAGNKGLIYGSGFSGNAVSNHADGEIRTLNGQWAQFGGGATSTNAGEINNFNGTIEFAGDLTNESGGFIGGRGQLIVGGGTTNNGVMAFSAGNADVLGDVVNGSGGQIVTSGFGVTTFFDDVEHNGTEIRTANASATVFLGEVSGAGSFTGTGDVFFEGDLRPGNSPGVVNFEGDVFMGSGASTSIELAGLLLGEFDMLDVEGDLSLDGSLDVSLIDGFALDAGQEFLIANIEGSVVGQFDLLGEGDLVGNYGGQDLFISYSGGSGNDIGLFTTSIPEPGSAGILGIALIGLVFRRRRRSTPVNCHQLRGGLLAVLVISTFSTTGTVSADIVVTNRHSHGAFDVFGVYPGEFERRNVSDESTALMGMFTMSESFEAVVTNGFATGIFDHTDNVVSTNTELNITSTASMQGSATQGTDAVASSSIAEFLHVNFTVTGEGAKFRMTGDFDPADAFGDQVFLTQSFGALDAFRYSTAQAFDVTGTLAAGDYTFRLDNGSATNENTGFAFSGGHNFTLSITSVPEPGSLAAVGLFGTLVVLHRRRKDVANAS